MSKKLLATMIALLVVGALLAGCAAPAPSTAPTTAASVAPASQAPAANFVKAADIVPPKAQKLFALPVDQVSPKPIKIACIMVQNNPFGLAVMKGSDFAASVLKDRNCKVDWISVPDFDPKKFEDAIQNCITAQYDAICSFGLSEALQPVFDRGVDAGILMYAFNTEPGMKSKRQAFFGQDGFAGGQKMGQALIDAVGAQGGKYAIITGSFNVLGHELRRKGARDILDKNTAFQLVGEFENQDKAEEAYNITQNLITKYPDLQAIYVTAGGPFGAAKAVKDAGLTGKVKIICHDWMAETIPYVRSGEIVACLDQDPFNQAFGPIVCAFNKLVANQDPPAVVNWYPGDIATPANVAEKVPQ